MILVAYGTRPEIIKLFPVIQQLADRQVPFKTLFSGQHRELYNDVNELVPSPDFDFSDHYRAGATLGELFTWMCGAAEALFAANQFDTVVVQGDTATAWALAQVAFFNRYKVAHVEAGLRTNDLQNPYPEEANRRLITQLADFNFAPTQQAMRNLESAGARGIVHTGNTIVDAVRHFALPEVESDRVLITIHRRENHPHMPEIFDQLNHAAARLPELQFIFPMHPNPNVQRHRSRLTAPNIRVTAPVDYPAMLNHINHARFLITDSGGIQEEAVCLGRKALVVRRTTERPETIDAGFGKLVGLDVLSGLDWALTPPPASDASPYGDGHSAAKIVDVLAPGSQR